MCDIFISLLKNFDTEVLLTILEADKTSLKYHIDGAVLKPRNCKMLTFQETQKTRF